MASRTLTLRLEDAEWGALYTRAEVENVPPATIARQLLSAALHADSVPPDVIPARVEDMMSESEYLSLPVYQTPGEMNEVPWQSDDDPAWPEYRRRAWIAQDELFEGEA